MAARKQTPTHGRGELLTLAQAMLITAIGARGAVPTGDAIRQIVREARSFLSEIDKPTRQPRSPTPPQDTTPAAEFTDQNELDW